MIVPKKSCLHFGSGILALFALVVLALPAAAAPADLDLSFGGTGKIITSGLSTREAEPKDVAVQPDGKIVVAGSFRTNTTYAFGILRYLPDGTLDPSFNGTGKLQINLLPDPADGSQSASATCVAIQSDGKTLVAGNARGFSFADVVVMRLNPDGSPDTTFNGTGRILFSSAGVDTATDMKLLKDGRIVITGSTENPFKALMLLRLNSNGTPDQSFGTGGKVVTPAKVPPGLPGPGNELTGQALAVLDNGKILVTGPTALTQSEILRYHPDGTLDETFGESGRIRIPIVGDPSGYALYSSGISVQKDGKFLISASKSGSGPGDFAILRFHPDGSFDTSFNGTGFVVTPVGSNADVCVSLALQRNGKILAAGHAFDASSSDFGVVRYHPDGTLDTSFNLTGKVTVPVGEGDDIAAAMALQADGKILVTGSALVAGKNTYSLIRLMGDPAIVVASVDTLPAENVRDTTALLKGSINAHGIDSTVFFDYGTTPAYGNSIAATPSPVDGITPVTVSAAVIGLTTGTTYHYRLRAVNEAGTSTGPDLTFTPVIASEQVVEQPAGAILANNSRRDFGAPVMPGEHTTMEFVIRNTGTGDLTIADPVFEGTDNADFSAALTPLPPIHPGESAILTVTFTPHGGRGEKTATLNLSGNDPLRPAFKVNLAGVLANASQEWRKLHFDTFSNEGAAADLSDPDKDGIPNLIEFATGSNPSAYTLPPVSPVINGNNFELTYTRLKAALSEVNFKLEWTETLPGPWSSFGGSNATILSDDGTTQVVKTTIPTGSNDKRFARLRVTRL